MTDFIKLLNEEIEECETAEKLMDTSRILYGMRDFAGVRECCIPLWKDRARRFIPTWKDITVVAVDLNSMFHAAYGVQPDDATGLCLNMLRKVYKDLKPSVFSVCVDCRKGVTKKLENSGYKCSREREPEAFYQKLDATLDALRPKVRLEEHDGYEADDSLNTIAFQAALLGAKCVLVSRDKDMWQSLYPGVAMYDRKSGEFRNHDWLVATHRITRKQVVDWLCMVGGKNDLPGVPGIGEKRASDLLQAYSDFIGAMDHSENDGLKEFFDTHYFKVKELHTLSVGVPVRWFSDLKANK
jgi:DNA polymerase-1